MSTPAGTSDNNEQPNDEQHQTRKLDQRGEPIEPIDPTLTFDAYFEKHNQPSTPSTRTGPETADSEAADTDSGPRTTDSSSDASDSDLGSTDPNYTEPRYTEPRYTEPTYTEPTYAEPAYNEPTYAEPAYNEPSETEPGHTEPGHTDSAHTDSPHSRPSESQPTGATMIPSSQVGETVSPARYSAPEQSTTQTGEPAMAAAYRPESELPPQTVRMRTVVFGLVLLVIAGAVLVGQLTDVAVNASAIALALMIGGGLLLIAGARRA